MIINFKIHIQLLYMYILPVDRTRSFRFRKQSNKKINHTSIDVLTFNPKLMKPNKV